MDKHYIYNNGIFIQTEKFAPGAKGVFETMRSHGGVIFGLEKHLKRLKSACRFLRIKLFQAQQLMVILEKFLKQKRIKNARIRLTVIKKSGKTCVYLSFFKLSRPMRGYCVLLIDQPRRKRTSLNGIKSTRREFYEKLFQKAQKARCHEAVFLNTRGAVVEGTRTNVFIVKDGILHTPALKDGCLPGVTRFYILKFAKDEEIPVRQRILGKKDLLEADEVFVTNAVIGVMPVLKINGGVVGHGRAGKITSRFTHRYKILIEKERKRG